jgi:phosphoserine phosphatase
MEGIMKKNCSYSTTRGNRTVIGKKREKLMTLSAVGFDSPGLVSKIAERIRDLDGNILDIEETCRRSLFSIFLIVDFSASPHPVEKIRNSLVLLEAETGLKIMVTGQDDEEADRLPRKENHLITILGLDRPGIMAAVSRFFYQRNINIERCRMIARGDFFSVEMVIDSSRLALGSHANRKEAIDEMAGALRNLCQEMDQSVVIQSGDIFRKLKKLVVFDVESSLLQEDSLREFLERVRGKLGEISDHMRPAGQGENQLQTLLQNARRVQGIPIHEFEAFSDILQLNPGSFELIRILKSMGFKIALLSSGFNFLIKKILEEAGVDYAFSNSLQVDENGMITGKLADPVITSDTKQEILEFIMKVEGIGPDQVIAVGDGSAGSHFIENAGLSIAFKPQETGVRADGVLSTGHITNILYCLGIPKGELERHLKVGSPE